MCACLLPCSNRYTYVSLVGYRDRRCRGYVGFDQGVWPPADMHTSKGTGRWPRSRHGREECVTYVVDGPQGANARAARKDEGESFSTVTVGKPEVDRAGWILDDILSADEQPGSDGSRGTQALTQ